MTKAVIDDRGWPHSVFGLGTVQNVAYTDSAGAISNAVGAKTTMVRIWATTDCHIAVAASPTATTSSTPLTAKAAEYLKVVPGSSKVSAIRQSVSGTLYVTELT